MSGARLAGVGPEARPAADVPTPSYSDGIGPFLEPRPPVVRIYYDWGLFFREALRVKKGPDPDGPDPFPDPAWWIS